MVIRMARREDAEAFFAMLCRLDRETVYMMYEPDERAASSDAGKLRSRIEGGLSGGDLILVAEEDGAIAGFLWAERGQPRRIAHTAYIVDGIREPYRGRGLGTGFFHRLDEWARANGVLRLELTVECANSAALRLYEKSGFAIEGVRRGSMLVDGALVDEYYMAKVFRA